MKLSHKNQYTSLFCKLIQNSESALKYPNKVDWRLLVEIARENNILGRFAYLIKSSVGLQVIPTAARRHFETALIQSERISTQVIEECESISTSLSNINIPSVILKGGAYSNLDCIASKGRSYTDIDILVPKNKIDLAAEHLLCFGWVPQVLSDYDERYYREWAHEIPPLYHNKRGTVIDVHHNLIPPISGRAPNIELFNNNLNSQDKIQTLNPSAMVLHSAVHLFTSEEFDKGFRDLSDIYLLIKEYRSDQFWDEITKLAEASKFTLELFLAIRFCKIFFALEIPGHVSNQINNYKKSKIKLKYWDYLFTSVLAPHHHSFNPVGATVPFRLAFLRGHYIKMPFPVLIKHTAHKVYISVVEMLFGRAFLDKELDGGRK